MIEADGYLPAVSPRFKAPGWHHYDFALEKGVGLSGRVKLPGGGYARNAELFLAVPSDELELDETARLRSETSRIVVSNSNGEFQFSARFEPNTIFAVHTQGFVRMDVEEFSISQTVQLKPWGQVVGKVDGQVAAGARRFVNLRSGVLSQKRGVRGLLSIKLEYNTAVGPDGSFSFQRVPPGDYELTAMLRSALDEHGESRILGTRTKKIVVSKSENGTKQPFDVGTLRLQVKPKGVDEFGVPLF